MARYQDILDIARVTIDTLKEIGVDECYFIGGMACKLYTGDQGRQPKDLDILCLPSYPDDAEDIKRRLCQKNDHFYTIRARNPRDDWTALWWYTDNDELGFERFKIDILVPGKLDLPYVHPNYIIKVYKLPCAPLHLLLLHKLKAWEDRHSSPPHLRAKIPGDIRDIKDLLEIAKNRGLKINKNRPYISDSFRNASYGRVKKFVRQHPEYTQDFMCLGLPNPAGWL